MWIAHYQSQTRKAYIFEGINLYNNIVVEVLYDNDVVAVCREVADAAKALIYLAQGDISNAAISGAAFVPVIGSAGTLPAWRLKGLEKWRMPPP